MSAKAKKLAWELIEVLSRYSDKDVEVALSLLGSGDLFRDPLDLLRALKKRPSVESQSAGSQLPFDVDAFERHVSDLRLRDEREILTFFHQVMSGKMLKSGRHLRDYATFIELDLPKKIPARSVVSRRIVERLIELTPDQRRNAIRIAEEFSDDVSSLKAWSDLIVKS